MNFNLPIKFFSQLLTLALLVLVASCEGDTEPEEQVADPSIVECFSTAELQSVEPEAAIAKLKELGFWSETNGDRSFHPDALKQISAEELVPLHQAISRLEDGAMEFWLTLAGSTLADPTQAACFVRVALLPSEQEKLVTTLRNFSELVKRMSDRPVLVKGMSNIVEELDGETLLAYMQKEQAVVYSSSIQGYVSNKANARHNRKRMAHLPNSLMIRIAEILERDDVVHKSTIYQVEHMGYEEQPGS